MAGNKRKVEVNQNIGVRVMLARRKAKLTQKEVARQVPMSPTALNRLENGLQSVSGECIAALARILHVSADWLLGVADEDEDGAMLVMKAVA
jgi:transcriptional regulator with XRE-family HTH domain